MKKKKLFSLAIFLSRIINLDEESCITNTVGFENANTVESGNVEFYSYLLISIYSIKKYPEAINRTSDTSLSCLLHRTLRL